ncbi:hypothetical protein EJB05_56698, partial [Eragrostis curvula]
MHFLYFPLFPSFLPPTPRLPTSTSTSPRPPHTHKPSPCRRYCLPSRPATQPPIDIDVPGDPAIQTPPNFTSIPLQHIQISRQDLIQVDGDLIRNVYCSLFWIYPARLMILRETSRNAMRLSDVTERPHHDPTNRSPFQLVRMDDDVEKRYENMKSKTRALSNII